MPTGCLIQRASFVCGTLHAAQLAKLPDWTQSPESLLTYTRTHTALAERAHHTARAQSKYYLNIEDSIQQLFNRPEILDNLSWDHLPPTSPFINLVHTHVHTAAMYAH